MSNKTKQGAQSERDRKAREEVPGEEVNLEIDTEKFEGCEADSVVEYTTLITQNAASGQELARQGVTLSGMGMIQKRLEMFIDLAFEGEKQARLNFEIAYQRALREAYDKAESEVRRMRLMAPVGGRKLHVPGVTD